MFEDPLDLLTSQIWPVSKELAFNPPMLALNVHSNIEMATKSVWSWGCQIIWMIPTHAYPIHFVHFSSTTLIIWPQLNMGLVFPSLPRRVYSLLMDIWVGRYKERWRDALAYLSEGLLFFYGPGSRTQSRVHNGQVSYHCATIQARLPFSEASADKAWRVDLPCILSAGSL